MESIEGMYCKVHTRTGKTYTGTILTTSPSVHVQDDARTLERKEKHMEVRLDEVVHNAEDVAELEIGTGDFISFFNASSPVIPCSAASICAAIVWTLSAVNFFEDALMGASFF